MPIGKPRDQVVSTRVRLETIAQIALWLEADSPEDQLPGTISDLVATALERLAAQLVGADKAPAELVDQQARTVLRQLGYRGVRRKRPAAETEEPLPQGQEEDLQEALRRYEEQKDD